MCPGCGTMHPLSCTLSGRALSYIQQPSLFPTVQLILSRFLRSLLELAIILTIDAHEARFRRRRAVDDQSRKLAAVEAAGVDALGEFLELETFFGVVAVDYGAALFGGEEGLVFVP